jgi:hypothetical protein
MKSQHVLIPIIISIILISGCVSDGNILNMAKNSPTIKEFLSDYPNAEINLQSMKKADIENDSDFISQCSNVQANEYYKVVITDISSGLKAFAFVDKENGVVCAFKEGTSPPETCTASWSCTDWSPVTCPSSGIQTRTCTDANGCGSLDNKPDETHECTYMPPQMECTETWSCSDWSECTNGMQTRTCVDSNNCGTTYNKPSISQSCNIVCTEDWSCSVWSECIDGIQTRTCSDSNKCGNIVNRPIISQSCSSIPICTSNYRSECKSGDPFDYLMIYDSCDNLQKQEQCNHGCANGLCLISYPIYCEDEDNGDDTSYRSKVTVSYENSIWKDFYYDECADDNNLVEYHCLNNNATISYHICSIKCDLGICIQDGPVCGDGLCENVNLTLDYQVETTFNISDSEHTAMLGLLGLRGSDVVYVDVYIDNVLANTMYIGSSREIAGLQVLVIDAGMGWANIEIGENSTNCPEDC